MTVHSARRLAVLGAASSIGIRPYDGETEARHLDRAPDTLRKLGLVDRLAAIDLGNVTPAPYRDFTRPPGGVRNEREVAGYSRTLDELAALVRQLALHPRALGMQITIYDPALNPELTCARRLVALLASSLGEGAQT